MLALGTWGFGGPDALVGFMYCDLVEKRGWISEGDYKEGMDRDKIVPAHHTRASAASVARRMSSGWTASQTASRRINREPDAAMHLCAHPAHSA